MTKTLPQPGSISLIVLILHMTKTVFEMSPERANAVESASPVLLSQPLPPHFVHRGLQDGWTSDTVCAKFYGGVRRVLGAGKPREHLAVHALYDGEL